MAVHLDLTSFANAVDRLTEGKTAFESDRNNPLYRDAMIQRFEFTYEMSHKMLKRFLEMTSASPQAVDAMAFQDLIRTGSEQGLLKSGWPDWKAFRTARASTSHGYDEAKANEVASIVPAFLEESRFLLGELQKRISAP